MSSFMGGWPAIFYLAGIVGIVWCVIWLFVATSTPEDHRFISVEEKNYILEVTAEANLSKDNKVCKIKPLEIIYIFIQIISLLDFYLFPTALEFSS